MPKVSDTMPVTLLAAENEPILSGRSAYRRELRGELGLVDVPVGVLADGDDVGDATRARAARWSGARTGR